jgi:hypothetical protein
LSHFFGVVLVPKKTPRGKLQEVIGALVEKYNEGREVPEYDQKCSCIGQRARGEVSQETIRRMGTIHELRERFHKANPAPSYPNEKPEMSKEEKKKMWEEYNKKDEEHTKIWMKAIEPYADLEKHLFAEHPDSKKPNPECSDCHGKGTHKTAYNPDSKWDWWVIGGRWTGAFTPDYDPSEDPRNIETCRLCNGTGKRDDELGKEERKRNPEYGCNGCNGTGKSVKYSFAKHKGDIMPASKVPEKVTPYSLVTPDGKWYAKGEMGWFGMSDDNKSEEKWEEVVKGLFKKHKDCLAVVVDYHI